MQTLGVRVDRAFGFVDLCGFTSYTDVHGDERAVHVLSSFRSAVREVASRRGVRLAKWLGDGAMFVSMQHRDLVETILEIDHRVDRGDSPLALRAGVASGAVILFEGDDYIGSPVNLAARLCDLSEGNEVLATTDFEGMLPAWAEVSAVTPMLVTGFSQAVRVMRVRSREAGDDAFLDPVCHMRLPPDSAVERRSHGSATVLFCSAACAAAWDDGQRGPVVLAVEG
jgi:class 3 adenylate cyclase